MKKEEDDISLPRILQVGEYAPITPFTILIQLLGPYNSEWRSAFIKGFIARATSNWSHSLQRRVLGDILFVTPISFDVSHELASLCVRDVFPDLRVDKVSSLETFELYHYEQVLNRAAFGVMFFYLPECRSDDQEELSFLSQFYADVTRLALQAEQKGRLERLFVVYDDHEPTSRILFRGLPSRLQRRKDLSSPETLGSNFADYVEKFLVRS